MLWGDAAVANRGVEGSAIRVEVIAPTD